MDLFQLAIVCSFLTFNLVLNVPNTAECQNVTGSQRKNVLLLIVDDLRPEIGAFIDEEARPWLNSKIKTPNLDALAARSLVLKKAFVQYALCNPSRSSFLTSRYPDTTQVYDNDHFFRQSGLPNVVTLPQYFKQNNYTSIGSGKIYHIQHAENFEYFNDEGYSWSEKPVYISNPLVNRSWVPVEQGSFYLHDQQLRDIALEKLDIHSKIYQETGQPFFYAVGLKKPHLPFMCPEQFFDLYSLDEIHKAENEYCPRDMPSEAWFGSGELLRYSDLVCYNWTINSTLNENDSLNLRRAYYSCVSYADKIIGDIIHKLEELGMRDDTVVGFVADHGWHLGENGIWGKPSLFELATNAPLMISIPGLTDAGITSHNLVELVDLFPTLAEAAGLPSVPQCPKFGSSAVDLCTEGRSLIPLIEKPNMGDWRHHSLSVYKNDDRKGYSLRSKKFRYNEFVQHSPGFPLTWPQVFATELYDLENDPRQTVNVVNHPKYARTVQELSETLHNMLVPAQDEAY